MAMNFPIELPKEETGAKRKLAAANSLMAQFLSTRVIVGEENLKAKIAELGSSSLTKKY